MVNLVPGFVWRPIDVTGRAKRSKGRGLIAHVAVSESANLVPSGTPATRSADWHFYLPKSGPGIQYIDLDYQCWSSAGANATCPAFESQGGVNSPQTEPWTANQIELAAQILAHLHKTEGTPLQVMPNSLPTSKGIAPHRWGISPWRVAGGEVWSSSNGKVCPGDAKVAQLPQIVARATAIVNGTPTPAPTPTAQENEMRLIRTPDGTIWTVTDTEVTGLTSLPAANALAKVWGPWTNVEYAEKDAIFLDADARAKARLTGVQNYILGANPKDKPYLYDRIADLGNAVKALQSGGVDPAVVAKLVLGGLDGAQLNVSTPPAG